MARSLFDRSFLYEASLKNRAQCCCHFYFFFPFVPGPRNPLFGVGRFLGFHVHPRPAWDTFNHAVSTGDFARRGAVLGESGYCFRVWTREGAANMSLPFLSLHRYAIGRITNAVLT